MDRGYHVAVAIGYYLLIPPKELMPGSILQCYQEYHHDEMNLYRKKIATAINPTVHNEAYAIISLVYVLHMVNQLFVSDARALHMFETSRAQEHLKKWNQHECVRDVKVFVDTMFVSYSSLFKNITAWYVCANQTICTT